MRTAPSDPIGEALGAVWDGMRREGFWDCRITAQREGLRSLASAARACGILPERLLPQLKGSWKVQPEVVRSLHRLLADERRDQIITLVIDAYYDTHGAHGCSAPEITRN